MLPSSASDDASDDKKPAPQATNAPESPPQVDLTPSEKKHRTSRRSQVYTVSPVLTDKDGHSSATTTPTKEPTGEESHKHRSRHSKYKAKRSTSSAHIDKLEVDEDGKVSKKRVESKNKDESPSKLAPPLSKSTGLPDKKKVEHGSDEKKAKDGDGTDPVKPSGRRVMSARYDPEYIAEELKQIEAHLSRRSSVNAGEIPLFPG